MLQVCKRWWQVVCGVSRSSWSRQLRWRVIERAEQCRLFGVHRCGGFSVSCAPPPPES